MHQYRLLFLLLLAAQAVFAQTDSETAFPELKIGEWQQHLPWQRARSVTTSATKVYYATEWSVVEIDKAERSPRFLYKTQGFNDVGVRLVRFNRTADALFVAYNNSNIDLYYPATEKVVNLPFIVKNTILTGDKNIKNIFFDGENAFIAAGFGALKLNLRTAEVDFTVFTGVVVNAFAILNGYYYMGTDDGLFRIAINDANPADFSRWELLNAVQGFPGGASVQALAIFNNALYAGIKGSGLLKYNGSNVATVVHQTSDLSVTLLTTEGTGLVSVWKKNGVGNVLYFDENDNFSEVHGPCSAQRALDAVEDGSRKFWFADEYDQFRYFDPAAGTCDFFNFNSPYNQYTAEIALRGNKVFVATLGADPNLNPVNGLLGLYVRGDDGQWRRISGDSNPELLTGKCNEAWWRVAPHPTDERLYIGSFSFGLVEMNDDGSSTKCFTKDNSALQDAGASGTNRTAIGGMAFDKDDNLWICNYGADKPVAVMKPDGTILNYSISGSGNFTKVGIDKNGYKWFASAFTSGLAVYDSGKDLEDTSDDRFKALNTSNSVLATNEVTTLEVDLDGDVWVGTKEGLYSFECTGSIFNEENPCKGTRQIITVDGFNGYLLQDENIKTIAIDGANRKWVGTSNGIFVQSPDGRTTLARFDVTNSPLPSNLIDDIAINPTTGEVWIGTTNGIVSVRTDATVGGKVNSAAPYAYPNPVRPDYDGPIAIYGLARDANVKITDIAGHLVYEGTANGGQAIWNGRDYLGRRAASGVYLVYATSSESFDTPDAVVTKVVIVN